MRCHYCEGLSISKLVQLAEHEFSAHNFPSTHFYRHHPSFSELQTSAENGCDLCLAFLQGLLNAPCGILTVEGDSWEPTIRDLAEEGKSTDIKISINANHLYLGREIGQAHLFDSIMVQAGIVEPEEETEETERIYPLPTLEFVIYAPSDKQEFLNGYRVGRKVVDSDLASQRNFDLALSWLKECENHQTCPSLTAPRLPTRVIDVGIKNDYKDLRLLVTNDLESNYIALSHCWGGKVTPLLTTENLELWQQGISLSELPANFRDAIMVTKRLGQRYVWIDALCIIQNSAEDWANESKQMGTLYRNAYFTISALTSQKSKEGFLKNLPLLQKKEDMIDLRLSSEAEDTRTVKLALKLAPEEDESLVALFGTSALHTRGWCLQERVISPRVLHYGSRQIYFQCSAGFKSADSVPPHCREPHSQFYKGFSGLIHAQKQTEPSNINDEDLSQAREEYYQLVIEYSKKNLTFGTDKFPAFSGVAMLMKSAFQEGDYIAGVWSNDLAHGLCWYDDLGSCRHARGSYRAPSWSWAVTDDCILFPYDSGREGSIANGKYDIELVEFVRVPKGDRDDTYGQLSDAKLVVRAYTKRFVRSRQHVGMHWPAGGSAQVRFDEFEEGQKMGDNHCHVFEATSDNGAGYLLSIINGEDRRQVEWDVDASYFDGKEYIAMVTQATHTKYDEFDTGQGHGLVLMRVEGTKNSYSRVGYLNLGLPDGDGFERSLGGFEKWMKTWEHRVVTLV